MHNHSGLGKQPKKPRMKPWILIQRTERQKEGSLNTICTRLKLYLYSFLSTFRIFCASSRLGRWRPVLTLLACDAVSFSVATSFFVPFLFFNYFTAGEVFVKHLGVLFPAFCFFFFMLRLAPGEACGANVWQPADSFLPFIVIFSLRIQFCMVKLEKSAIKLHRYYGQIPIIPTDT